MILTWNQIKAQELGLRFGDVLGNNVAIDGVLLLTSSAEYMLMWLLETED
jgi:hypothetical protein